MKNGKRAMFWVYNEETGSLTRKRLTYREQTMESWFEDSKCTYDPFYVSRNKLALIKSVTHQLDCELQEALNNANRIIKLIQKLKKKT